MASETHLEIEVAAADWVARIDRRPLSPTEVDALEDWLAGDDRRRGAFMRMRAIALHTERARALGPDFDPDAFARGLHGHTAKAHPSRALPSLFARRHVLWGAGAAACVAGVAGVTLLGHGVVYDTRLGEIRVISLEDGSVLTLNTASKTEVHFDSHLRSVRLVHGEAMFDVAKDPARPFVVDAGDARVRAVGTSFTVRRLPQMPVMVLVREGVVEVRRPRASATLRLAANTRAEVAPGRVKPLAIKSDDVARELAWREGRIAFEGDTLEDAASQFARYSATRVVIDDPSVGREEITGLFAANDPVSFAKAAALSLGLHAEVEAGQVRLSR